MLELSLLRQLLEGELMHLMGASQLRAHISYAELGTAHLELFQQPSQAWGRTCAWCAQGVQTPLHASHPQDPACTACLRCLTAPKPHAAPA